MPRSAKRPKNVGVLRFVLANNVVALLPVIYHSLANETARRRKLAQSAGVSLSTVQRICSAEIGASLDSIEHIARALGVSVVDLLTPSEATRRSLNIRN